MRFPREKCADLGICRSFSWMVKSIKKVKFEWEISLGIIIESYLVVFPPVSVFFFFLILKFYIISFCIFNKNKHLYIKRYHLLFGNAVLYREGSCGTLNGNFVLIIHHKYSCWIREPVGKNQKPKLSYILPKQENLNIMLWRLYIFLRAQLTNRILQVHLRVNLTELKLPFLTNNKPCRVWTQQWQKCNKCRGYSTGEWIIIITLCKMIIICCSYSFL